MTSPFAPFRLSISMHIHANYQFTNAPQFLHYSLHSIRFWIFFWHEKVTNKENLQLVPPQMQLLTPKIQCNVQIAWIRLNRIINIGRFFSIKYINRVETWQLYLSNFAYVVSIQFMAVLCWLFFLFSYEGSFAFWPAAVRPVTKILINDLFEFGRFRKWDQ